MLISNKTEMILNAHIILTFEDQTIKEFTLKTGDIIHVTYNKDGNELTMEGKIKDVFTHYGDDPTRPIPYLIVDGSTAYSSNIDKICIDKILDLTVVTAS